MSVSLIRDGDSDSNLDNCNALQQLKLLKKFFYQEVSCRNIANILRRKVTRNFTSYFSNNLK
jgi:hypothetical protein